MPAVLPFRLRDAAVLRFGEAGWRDILAGRLEECTAEAKDLELEVERMAVLNVRAVKIQPKVGDVAADASRTAEGGTA